MERLTSGWHCGECGSTHLRFTLGPCAECGKSLDGELDPKSRSAGMFHAACWAKRVSGGVA